MYHIFSFLSLPFELFSGQRAPLVAEQSPTQQILQSNVANGVADAWNWVVPMGAAPPYGGLKIGSHKDWRVTCDSELDEKHSCQQAIEGQDDTFWLTTRNSSHPSVITLDLGATEIVNGIGVLPRQDDSMDGNIASHEIYASSNGRDWSTPVAYGTWWMDHTEKRSVFEPVPARYVRLLAFSDATSSNWTAITEFNVYKDPNYTPPPTAGIMGKWGPSIDTPLVPVTAFVDPFSGQVVLLSSKRHDSFPQDERAYTVTAIWDPISKALTQGTVEKTKHNMFCPGLTFDAEGRMIVTGGASGHKTTIFDGAVDDPKFHGQWHSAAEMEIPRGYQSTVLNADGRMLALGGSWGAHNTMDPATEIKNGELYDPKTDTWTSLPQCRAEPLWTNDRAQEKIDNHLWLFAWKDDTVIQAGPSKYLNWYTLTGTGGTAPAGTRTPADGRTDDDAMCGEAVMYDAVAGHIVTFGGASDYDKGGPASNSAFILTLGEPNATVAVERVQPMAHNRTYASAIVVPNGDVFVSGGQHGVPEVFVDQNPVFEAELFSPTTKQWIPLAPNSIVRVYHSWTLLLPDATILNGGGGLCGDACNANHFDFQVFTPPYLLTTDGRPAPRPVITQVSDYEVRPGDVVTVTTDRVIASASLIRYGSTTHAVNTDQRRIPLELDEVGG